MPDRKRIIAGVSVDQALRAFQTNGTSSGDLFSRQLDQLRLLLSDPITAEQAEAIRDVLQQWRELDELILWLQNPAVSWINYAAFCQETEPEPGCPEMIEWPPDPEKPLLQDDAAEEAAIRESLIDSFLPAARPCPRCGTPPEFLLWSPWSTSRLAPSGYSGFRTSCRFCLAAVDFFELMHWTTGRTRKLRNSAFDSRTIH